MKENHLSKEGKRVSTDPKPVLRLPHAQLDEVGDKYKAVMWIKKGKDPYKTLFRDIREIKLFLAGEYEMSAFPTFTSYDFHHDDMDYVENESIEEEIKYKIVKLKRNELLSCNLQ